MKISGLIIGNIYSNINVSLSYQQYIPLKVLNIVGYFSWMYLMGHFQERNRKIEYLLFF